MDMRRNLSFCVLDKVPRVNRCTLVMSSPSHLPSTLSFCSRFSLMQGDGFGASLLFVLSFNWRTMRNFFPNPISPLTMSGILQDRMPRILLLWDSIWARYSSLLISITWVMCVLSQHRKNRPRNHKSQSKATFGFHNDYPSHPTRLSPTERDNIGKVHLIVVQAAPSLSNSFSQIFGTKSKIPSLIPCVIGQDPYFWTMRDVAHKLKYPKPVLIHAKFAPGLRGAQPKMSANVEQSSIFNEWYTEENQQEGSLAKHFSFLLGADGIDEIGVFGRTGRYCWTSQVGRTNGDDVAYPYLIFSWWWRRITEHPWRL